MFLKLLNLMILITITKADFELNPSCDDHSKCIIPGQVCYENKCWCQPNYKYDVIGYKCYPFDCKTDLDCRTYDQDRVCRQKFCECKVDYEVVFESGIKCVPKTYESTVDQNKSNGPSSNWWIYVVCFLTYLARPFVDRLSG